MPEQKGAQDGAADPSMEDILASIRRILNEEDNSPAPVPAAAEAPAQAPRPEVPMAAAPPAPPPRPEVPMAAAPPAPPPRPAVPMAAPDPTEALQLTDSMLVDPPPLAQGLLDAAAAAAAAASMGQLMRTVAADRGAAVHRGGPTIEDVVREELRPLLKAWLDRHLPPLVERLVRAEIERVVGRAVN